MTYDFILVGSGIAGLSLAHALVTSPLAQRSILIIEPQPKTRNDRTLGFWSDRPTPFDTLIYRSWDRLRVATGETEQVHPCGRFRYHVIRGIDFYRYMDSELARFPSVTRVQAAVDRIEDGPAGVLVHAAGQTYAGRWVFDSRFYLAELAADPAHKGALVQRFVGWEIETPHDTFDPTTPIFMDFRVPQRGDVRFCYILPYSARHALVEFVAHGPEPGAELHLKRYIEKTLGIRAYQIVAKEGGASPLSAGTFARRSSPHVMRIGTAGGRIKPSSGYGFTRMLADSEAIVASLLRAGHPFDVPGDKPFFRFCDAQMLRLMRVRPTWIKPLFGALFRRSPLPRIFAFLDETTTAGQNVVLTLNLIPELAAQLLAGASRKPSQQPASRADKRATWL